MTTQAVLILGIKLEPSDEFQDYNDLIAELRPSNAPSLNVPVILVIKRTKDSIQPKDYGFYLAFKHFNLGKAKLMNNVDKLSRFLTYNIHKVDFVSRQLKEAAYLISGRNMDLSVLSIYTDYYDFNEYYTFYS